MRGVIMNDAGSSPDKPKKVGRPPKNKKAPVMLPETNLPSSLPPHLTDVTEIDDVLKQTINNILQNSANKYAEMANNQHKTTRSDFEVLQPLVSEFLENFIIIGHTLDGQRIVARYTKNPAGLDGLTELCKKVLVNMMIQESQGTTE